MIRRAVILIGIMLALLGACAAPAPHPSNEVLRRILVTFNADASEGRLLTGGSPRTYARNNWAVPLHVSDEINRLSKRYDLKQVDAWPIASLKLHCVVFAIADDRDLARLLAQLTAEPSVDGAQPMNEFEGLGLPVTESSSKRFALQYGNHAANVTALHRLTLGAPARVGVVDTLVDEEHPDLRGQISRQYAYVGEPGDDLLHGTAVAGIISASGGRGDGLVGLAPAASLYVYGACRARGENHAMCNSFTLAKALEQAIEDRVEVLNLSLSGPRDPLLARQLSVLLSRSVIVIAAVDANDPTRGFPASMDGVIAVRGETPIKRSDRHAKVTGAGCAEWMFDEERLSTRANGGYQFFYGSSMSAAAASGFAALLRSREGPAETAAELRALVAPGEHATTVRGSDFLVAVRNALRCDEPSPSVTAERGG